jgi:3-dehydroquinate dehydratase
MPGPAVRTITSRAACLAACRGDYSGDEAQRLAILKYAAVLGAAFVDVELKAAPFFFAGELGVM